MSSTNQAIGWALQTLGQYSLVSAVVAWIVDQATVQASVRLRAPADVVWQLLLRKDTFLHVTRGMVGFTDVDRWPARLFTEGVTLTTGVRLFGIGPATQYTVEVVRVDDARMEIETREHGGLIESWKHHLQVQPLAADECLYTDRIELRAGVATPLVWLFTAVFYRYRQWRWRGWVRASQA
ncbi:MAG: hypothetical protein U0746_11015 [Gemmataceae bacterium]